MDAFILCPQDPWRTIIMCIATVSLSASSCHAVNTHRSVSWSQSGKTTRMRFCPSWSRYVMPQVRFKGNTTQVAELAVLYEFEPPIRINITTSNHTTINRFRSYQGNKMKCDL